MSNEPDLSEAGGDGGSRADTTDRPTTREQQAVDGRLRAGQLEVESASAHETAAIAAALAEYLEEREEPESESATEPETWDGKRFAFAGRIAGLTGRARRVPRGAPTDNWTAAGRTDRFER